MINLSNERKERIIENKYFENENVFEKHIEYLKSEDKKLNFVNRTCEVRNWLDIIKNI